MHDVELETEARGPLVVHLVPHLHEFGVDAFVTERRGGVSLAPFDSLNLSDFVGDDADHVVENRRRLAAAIGVEPPSLTFVHQVHGTNLVDAHLATPLTQADVIVTERTDRALCLLYADCVPILLVDSASSRLAVAHAGWRGLSRGVVVSALGYFDDPRRIHAFIGPSISVHAYEVGPEVASHFSHVPGATRPGEGDRHWLDLRAVTAFQLTSLGVPEESLTRSVEVTDGGATFFSHRAHQPCGRFSLVAKRRDP